MTSLENNIDINCRFLSDIHDEFRDRCKMVAPGKPFPPDVVGRVRRQYQGRTSTQHEELENMLRSVNVDCINIASDKPYLHELIKFFRMREKRR